MLKVLRIYNTQVSSVPVDMNTTRTPVSSPHPGPMMRDLRAPSMPMATSTSSSGIDVECDTKPLPIIATLMYALGVGMLLYAFFGDSSSRDASSSSSCASCDEPSKQSYGRAHGPEVDDIGSHVNRALEPYVVLQEKNNATLSALVREIQLVKARVEESRPEVKLPAENTSQDMPPRKLAALPVVDWEDDSN